MHDILLWLVAGLFAAGMAAQWVFSRQSRRRDRKRLREATGQIAALKTAYQEADNQSTSEKAATQWYRHAFESFNGIALCYGLNIKRLPDHFLDVSDQACEILEYSREELLALSPLELETFGQQSYAGGGSNLDSVALANTADLAAGDNYARRNMEIAISQILRDGSLEYQGGYITRSGRMIPVSVKAFRIDLGAQPRILCFAVDIGKIRESEAELARLSQLVRDLMSHAGVGLAIFDRSREVTQVNMHCLKIFGLGDRLSFSRLALFDSPYLPDSAKTRLNRGESFRCEMVVDFDEATRTGRFTSSRHGVGHFAVNVTNMGVEQGYLPRGHLVEIQDITALRNAEEEIDSIEEQLRQAKKMEAVGTLAGGVAHDFNNILTPILGYSEMGRDLCDEGSELREYLDEILTASLRAKQLVEQILVFSRRGESTNKPMALSPIVKEVVKQVASSAPESIQVRCSIRTDQDLVLGTPTQVHQILMNLCSNARYAMKDSGGQLDVSLTSFILGYMHKREFPSLATRKYLRSGKKQRFVRLSVRDTGPGMSEATMHRIFEPFFTTKPSGEGTGMGLALVQGIVTTLNGAIRVESETGVGTTFHVAIPIVEARHDADMVAAEPIPAGRGRVLFVDDEIAIVRMAGRMLTSLGYEAVVTGSSVEAWHMFEQDPGRFDVIVTDQVMPVMTGAELTRKVLTLRPEMPIVLCTGFSEKFPREKAEEAGIREFVMKPIIRRDLADAIARALTGTSVPLVESDPIGILEGLEDVGADA